MSTILITGASTGIGFAIATQLINAQHNLILTSNNFEELQQATQTLNTHPNKKATLHCFAMDVTNKNEIQQVVTQLDERSLCVDVLINNAGLALGGKQRFEDIDFDEVEKMMDVNIKGNLNVTKTFLKQLKKAPFARIINIGSITALHTYDGGLIYSMTKRFLKTISEALRIELVNKNITVSIIQPGLTRSNFHLNRFNDEKKVDETYRGITPLESEDVACAVEYIINAPAHIQIAEMTLTPSQQATVYHTHRNNN